ncbi:hypothetical protein [Caulobacter hibisci]|uniref:Uncharacterized protein n=1 Tax=Caulobacter hibisci TaxID=2035993 RepID=A0ABS0T108_9CAUL|nr:hypothetical protein [Caulobacter hibisci]MBI1685534.1 hypothetical protein [Caulobacter hibisci]
MDDRRAFLRTWLIFTLAGPTVHMTLWCAFYLAVVSTWRDVAPPGYGWTSLTAQSPALVLAWLWQAGPASLTGLVAAGMAPRLSRLPWLVASALVGGGFSAVFALLAMRFDGIAQAALLGALSAAIVGSIALCAVPRAARPA